MLDRQDRAVPAFIYEPQSTLEPNGGLWWAGWCSKAAARRAHRDCQRLPADGLTLTIGGAGGTNLAAGHRRTGGRTMWRPSNAQALIFVAAVVIMVSLAVLA
jgi:hypothetical protein